MKFILRYHWQVEEQLFDVISWYEKVQIGLGLVFLEKFDETIKHIETFPEGVEIKRKKYRVVKISKFPHVIVFEINKKFIEIYSVTHTSRKSSFKYKIK